MSTVRHAVLGRAATIVGNPKVLRLLLGISMQDLQEWLAGRGTPTINAFLTAVDIIEGKEHRKSTRRPSDGSPTS